MGYASFMSNIDAVIMGRKTYETVQGFDIPWPYDKPVFVRSNSLNEIPSELDGKVELTKGTNEELLSMLHKIGLKRLYIDGGTTINSFLKEDLIDEMTITTIPILLGGGARLFQELPESLKFNLQSSKTFLNQITQNHYVRK